MTHQYMQPAFRDLNGSISSVKHEAAIDYRLHSWIWIIFSYIIWLDFVNAQWCSGLMATHMSTCFTHSTRCAILHHCPMAPGAPFRQPAPWWKTWGRPHRAVATCHPGEWSMAKHDSHWQVSGKFMHLMSFGHHLQKFTSICPSERLPMTCIPIPWQNAMKSIYVQHRLWHLILLVGRVCKNATIQKSSVDVAHLKILPLCAPIVISMEKSRAEESK